jgi:hypothetical protein
VFGTGDLDKDDCADALASAPEEGAIYLLPGTCGVTDTGDTGDTGGAQDTADTGDTAPTETDTDTDPIDTADTADTADTVDTADTADTGECQEEFGWACTSAGTTPGWWVCLLPLAVVRRRRPAQRRP